ncbi:MAG TPA: phosphoribosylamine--glycine ligase [Candidatus Eisenbacteria bacterium]|nr:phosphoribosylamine--glycine ligase [Candidatus Eisenbacteria bacterium]
MSRWSVLVVGSGGREHALGWALARSVSVARVDAAPGNPGLARLGRNHDVQAGDLDGICELARNEKYDLVVIGPEDPLARGLGDRLRRDGVPVFGPGASGARLEASKAFAKSFMQRYGIPTAQFSVVRSMGEAEEALARWGAPIVVKASGLAAGKGVVVADTIDAAREACRACLEERVFGEGGEIVVLERKLEGEEVSILTITDGKKVMVLPSAQDHKRAFDGDEGPNTGGMGAYSPAPVLTPAMEETVMKRMILPTLHGLASENIDFRGVLYFGVMVTPHGPQVLEYNVRFGDPETQAILPRFTDFDFAGLCNEVARGELQSTGTLPDVAASACVVAAAPEYPTRGSRGERISGLDTAEETGALVFHAGTAMKDGHLVTAGGRILDVVATGDTLTGAVERAYGALDCIHFTGMRFRRDIARRALLPRT